jgi:bifunctional polynucleotide phosphatase/kinase
MSWRIVHDSLLIGRYRASTTAPTTKSVLKLQKIAAFDFDSTLVTSASGNRFGKDATDWKWWHGSVPGILRSLHEEGYGLCPQPLLRGMF